MKKLFYAYLFIFLNINITINKSTICITPTFVGYILLLMAFRELENESTEFTRLRPFAIGMAVYTGFCWLLDAFGIGSGSTAGTIILVLLGLVGLAVSLYILNYVIEGIQDAEELHAANLGSEKLRSVFKVLAVAEIIALVMMVIPMLSIPAMLVSFVAIIILLVRLHATWKAYEALEWRNL